MREDLRLFKIIGSLLNAAMGPSIDGPLDASLGASTGREGNTRDVLVSGETGRGMWWRSWDNKGAKSRIDCGQKETRGGKC